jgi:acetyl-CoA acetyltransferase
MATESTSTVREMPQELFDSFSTQFDALTQAIEDAGFPVLHTCQILLGETEDSLSLSSLSAVRNLRGETTVQMAAAAAAQSIMNGVTAVLKDETGNIPAERLMQLLPLTEAVIDRFIPLFTQAMAAHASQVLEESGRSGKEQVEVLMSALMNAVKNLRPKE